MTLIPKEKPFSTSGHICPYFCYILSEVDKPKLLTVFKVWVLYGFVQMNVIMMLSVMFLLIFLNGPILLASVVYCSNEFHKSARQRGHADHLLLRNSELEQEGLTLLFKAVDYRQYFAIKHPNLSIPSVYAQVIVLQCAKLAPAGQNEKEKKEYDNIPIALLFPVVCRNPWDHQSCMANTLLNGYFFPLKPHPI